MTKKDIESQASRVDVSDFLSYRDYLAKVFKLIKSENKRYSYLEFSEDLGLSRSNVSWLVITGRRKLTPTTMQKVKAAFGLKGDESRFFLTLVQYNNSRSPAKREQLAAKLTAIKKKMTPSSNSRGMLDYFSEWYHPVIREMTHFEEFRSDPAWIAKRFHYRLLPKQAKESLELLESLDLVRFSNELGRHVPNGDNITPSREVETMAAVRFHQKMIELGREAVTRVSEDRREINTLTLSVSPASVKEIRKKIIDLCRESLEIESDLEQSEKSDIYQLNIQLFPMTKPTS